MTLDITPALDIYKKAVQDELELRKHPDHDLARGVRIGAYYILVALGWQDAALEVRREVYEERGIELPGDS